MAGICPAPGPDAPLVTSMLGLVDCNVQSVVQTGYATLFQPSGAFAALLNTLLVVYIALIGYRLLLGRAQLNVSDFALTAVKLGAVVALTTQWGAYQALVYRFLFYGPQQLASVMLHGLQANGTVASGDVFDGLQRAFVDMTAFSPATPPGTPAVATPAPGLAASGLTAAGAGQLSTLLSKAGFDSLLLLGSSVVMLLSTLGVLLAAKVVLGILLATGPVFIALLLFDSTRGVFEGWVRASVAFAFAPLAVTLLLALLLTLLQPSLEQLETMRDSGVYTPGVAFGVTVLVAVFSGVALGLVGAGGAIAAGFRLPGMRRDRTSTAAPPALAVVQAAPSEIASSPRSARIASAVAARERRDTGAVAARPGTMLAALEPGGTERRSVAHITNTDRVTRDPPVEVRVGQRARRQASPRTGRTGERSSL